MIDFGHLVLIHPNDHCCKVSEHGQVQTKNIWHESSLHSYVLHRPRNQYHDLQGKNKRNIDVSIFLKKKTSKILPEPALTQEKMMISFS